MNQAELPRIPEAPNGYYQAMPTQRDAIQRASANEITDLIELGKYEAFHGSPIAGVEPLLRAVALARANTDLEILLRAERLLGICYGAAGEYARAIEALKPQIVSDIGGLRFRSQGFASTTIASIYRQVAEHSRAEEFDEFALLISDADPDVEFDAKLGLTADAIGRYDTALAANRLAVAESAATQAPGWRTEVRLDWVRCEFALLTNDYSPAVAAATSAVAASRVAKAPRHLSKSLMFLGVSYLTWAKAKRLGSSERKLGIANLRESIKIAEKIGATPLIWPSRMILASPDSGVRASQRKQEQELADLAIRNMLSGMANPMRQNWLAKLQSQGITPPN